VIGELQHQSASIESNPFYGKASFNGDFEKFFAFKAAKEKEVERLIAKLSSVPPFSGKVGDEMKEVVEGRGGRRREEDGGGGGWRERREEERWTGTHSLVHFPDHLLPLLPSPPSLPPPPPLPQSLLSLFAFSSYR